MRKKAITKVKIKIRKANTNDIDKVVQIEREIFPTLNKKHQYREELSNAFSHFYIVYDSETNEIIGYTIFWIIEKLLEIHHITVKVKYHLSGIGSTLMRFILKKAKQEKVEQIYLEVRKSNKNAIDFYQKFGFTEGGLRKTYYQNPAEDALVFKKSI